MQGVKRMRQATRGAVLRQLALPPGFRKIFESQKLESALKDFSIDNANLDDAIQITDPSSPDFGNFVFMAGYDDL